MRLGIFVLAVLAMGCSPDTSPEESGNPAPATAVVPLEAWPTPEGSEESDSPRETVALPELPVVNVPEPPDDMPRVLRDLCPFEYGCDFGEWLIVDKVPVFARFNDRSSQVGVVGPNECVETTRAHMVVDEPGLVIMKEASRPFEVGDTVWVMSYSGEGSYMVWSKGRQWHVLSDWPQEVRESNRAHTLRLPAATWWIELATAPPTWLALTNVSTFGVAFDYDVHFPNAAQGIAPCG